MITPWNWPINQIMVKIVPALATGCTSVHKPSEIAIHGSLVGTLTEMRELIDYQSKTSRSSVRYSYGLQYCSDSHPAGCADRNQAAFSAAV
jgi:hypothetical protein